MILHGDCREVMATLDGNSIDAIVSDPPYGLSFMGKGWDHGVPGVEFWVEALRVTKPGAHLLAFGGTRTYHRLACAIEDAGWEVRDCIAWVYGSGFPKSHNLKDDWQGWGTALKPAYEPIIVARKPLVGTVASNVMQYGTGGLNINGCRVGTDGGTSRSGQADYPKNADGTEDRSESWARTGHGIVEINAGRWPANFIHDGSDEVVGLFTNTRARGNITAKQTKGSGTGFLNNCDRIEHGNPGDSGSAARFFYCAKASKADRDGSTHPTMKPTDLMRYLCRLVTPPGGTVLDPFCGSGSTGKGAILEGFNFIGIEREAEYVEIAKARIEQAIKEFKQQTSQLSLF